MASSIRANLTIEMIMTAQVEAYVATRPFDIIDCHLQDVVGAGGQTVQVTTTILPAGATNLTNALPCIGATGIIERTTLLARLQDNPAVGDSITATGSATTTRGRLFFSILPDPV